MSVGQSHMSSISTLIEASSSAAVLLGFFIVCISPPESPTLSSDQLGCGLTDVGDCAPREYASTRRQVGRPAHPVTTVLLRSVALFGSLNWAPRACCCTLGGASARPQGGIYMTVLNRRNLLAAGGS